jgi:hypothetical protein
MIGLILVLASAYFKKAFNFGAFLWVQRRLIPPHQPPCHGQVALQLTEG